jgi:diaminopimelate decarboxylase
VEHAFETFAKLAHEHGDAFYLVHLDRFRDNLRALVGAFRAGYPRTALGYSYKTNYLPVLCRIADEEGCYAEVVSRMEYDLARRLGVPGSRVIFNGPLKSADDLEAALLAGALVNVDSLAEVEAIERLAGRRSAARLRVGLRCNFALAEGHASRFGLAGDELAEARARLGRLAACDLEALHCHFSARRDRDSFRARAERMVDIARALFPGAPPALLDLGGGLFGRLPAELSAQFANEVPDWDAYARAVGPVLAAAFPGPAAPELVLEPGAAVVADAVEFVCRVAALKRLGSRRVAVVTGSVQNVKATPNPVRLPLRAVRAPAAARGAGLPGPVDVMGYTCMEVDVLQPDFPGELAIGDFLVFGNVGAYTSVFKPPFIRPAPAMLACTASGDAFPVVRRGETLDDLLATYAL